MAESQPDMTPSPRLRIGFDGNLSTITHNNTSTDGQANDTSIDDKSIEIMAANRFFDTIQCMIKAGQPVQIKVNIKPGNSTHSQY